MATSTTTTYFCDGCKGEKQRSDLWAFVLAEKKMGGEVVAEAKFELCARCEGKLHDVLLPMLPLKDRERLEGIVRP